ncbi:MAG: hypothetical protein N2167_00585 [Flavobacteriales bacterium]|nr:hypothetical protein [Flavobacteriales bacterium]
MQNLVFFKNKSVWSWLKLLGQLMIAALITLACFEIIKGFKATEENIYLSFPLKEGYISHGGNSTIINYHHADTTAQQYALDITNLNTWGLRAYGIFPKDLNKYEIYGDTIFSPCDCKIVKVKNGLNDLPPGSMDTVNLAGNHIIFEYKNSLIVFAHLLKIL